MPLILNSSYTPPAFLTDGHAQTVFPSLLRCVRGVRYTRERVELPDGDFLDADWSCVGSRKLAIVAHGLEGCSNRNYVLGMVRAFNRRGWDGLGWNFRGCSGEPNRTFRLYHSGATDDLDALVQDAIQRKHYETLALVGFSLGANLTLKYAGERGPHLHPAIRAVIGISVPCDLASSSDTMAQPENAFYLRRFLREMRTKIVAKARQFPDRINDDGYERIRTFRDFDDRYTGPVHGFRDAADYYRQCSCLAVLPHVRVPTLVLNARDDPFLSPECFPESIARDHPWLHLDAPGHGGHVGFVQFRREGEYWSEQRSTAFALNPGP